MKLIEVSGKVASALGSDAVLRKLIGERFFPVVAQQGVAGYPFATYRNLGLTQNDDKDSFGDLVGKVEIEIAAQSYDEAVTTSGEVQRVMENFEDEDIEFKMTNYEEEFDPAAMVYVCVLTFDYDED